MENNKQKITEIVKETRKMRIPFPEDIPKINDLVESIVGRMPQHGESPWDFYLRQSNYIKEDHSKQIEYIINEVRNKEIKRVYNKISEL